MYVNDTFTVEYSKQEDVTATFESSDPSVATVEGEKVTEKKKILDILDKYNVKATFFVVGENAKYYKSTLKEFLKRYSSRNERT